MTANNTTPHLSKINVTGCQLMTCIFDLVWHAAIAKEKGTSCVDTSAASDDVQDGLAEAQAAERPTSEGSKLPPDTALRCACLVGTSG